MQGICIYDIGTYEVRYVNSMYEYMVKVEEMQEQACKTAEVCHPACRPSSDFSTVNPQAASLTLGCEQHDRTSSADEAREPDHGAPCNLEIRMPSVHDNNVSSTGDRC
jgi:hypothetical protein